MKKLLILTVISLSFATTYAQVSFNPKVGMNFTTVATETASPNPEAHIGFNAGADLRFKKKESWFFVQPGLHYYGVGAQPVAEGATQEDIEQIPLVNSLKVPLSAGMYLTGSDGLLRIRLSAGITPTVVENNPLGIDKSHFRGATVGLNGGVGIEVLFVTLDLSYEYGMSDLYRTTAGAANTFSVSAGIKIP